MVRKLAIIILVTYLQLSNEHPLETAQPGSDVASFFSNRIIGGVEAPEGHAAHMVALIIGYHVRALVCGASIITYRHILSAAHCIEPFSHWGELSPSFTGVVGSNFWNSTKTEIRFSHYVNHPKWDWNTIKNDIGLLITVEKIRFNDRVQRIALNCDWMDGGQFSSVTGWGRLASWREIPYRLQLLYVYTLSPKQCFEHMKRATQILGPAPHVDPEIEICTFYALGHGMCMGDSGSALVYEKEQKKKKIKYQIGLVSWGFPCGLGAPDVFVRVSGFKTFLQQNVGKDICNIVS